MKARGSPASNEGRCFITRRFPHLAKTSATFDGDYSDFAVCVDRTSYVPRLRNKVAELSLPFVALGEWCGIPVSYSRRDGNGLLQRLGSYSPYWVSQESTSPPNACPSGAGSRDTFSAVDAKHREP